MTIATAKVDQESRLTALEQARVLSEQLHAARDGQDVDAVALLCEMREGRLAELLAGTPSETR